jgi:hypothetical protein
MNRFSNLEKVDQYRSSSVSIRASSGDNDGCELAASRAESRGRNSEIPSEQNKGEAIMTKNLILIAIFATSALLAQGAGQSSVPGAASQNGASTPSSQTGTAGQNGNASTNSNSNPSGQSSTGSSTKSGKSNSRKSRRSQTPKNGDASGSHSTSENSTGNASSPR